MFWYLDCLHAHAKKLWNIQIHACWQVWRKSFKFSPHPSQMQTKANITSLGVHWCTLFLHMYLHVEEELRIWCLFECIGVWQTLSCSEQLKLLTTTIPWQLFLDEYKQRTYIIFTSKFYLRISSLIFIPQIRELRNLFGDDTMFVALQSNEKFPDEGFDVDVQSKLEITWDVSKANY